MKFGELKSKIEKYLIESYNDNSFKEEFKIFKSLVLENKKIKKLFFVYDELSSNKGYSKDVAEQFINECITIYENTINKITPKEIKLLKLWVSDVKSENQYEDIDSLFSSNILTLENKINSRKNISQILIKENKKSEVISIPIKSMVNIANQTIESYIKNLSESDKKIFINLMNEDDNKLNKEFDIIKKDLISKLESLKQNSDNETSNRIEESIEKIKSEKYDKLNYFKLKNLKENI